MNDHSDRGALTGQRRDVITYVCQRAGKFAIPPARLIWFDLERKQLQTNDFPAYTLTVIPNPAMASNTGTTNAVAGSTSAVLTPAQERRGITFGLGVVVGCALLLGLLWKTRHFWLVVTALFRPVHLQPLNPIERRLDRYFPKQDAR